MRLNRYNQTVYRKKFKLITDAKQLFNLVKAYKFVSIVDHKTVALSFAKTQNFPTILLSDIFEVKEVNNFLIILDKSTKTGFVLRGNFLIAEVTKNNLVIICNDYMEKIDKKC